MILKNILYSVYKILRYAIINRKGGHRYFMIKTLLGTLITLVIIVMLLICVCYWFLNYVTLEKLGYAEVEIAESELTDGEKFSITPTTLGIENMTVREIYAWFKSKVGN